MKSVVADRYGPPDILEIRDLPQPIPGPGDVRVRVRATTVSRTDCGNLRGHPRFARLFTGLLRPSHPVFGLDFAGTVDAVGDGVTRFGVGDRVFGIAPGGFGGHAEFLCMPAEAAIAPMPEGLSFTDAVVCEGVWYAKTSLDGLGVGPGDRGMVYGASGAIGIAALQLAKARGAEVIAVVGTENVDLARSLGADRVVDYTAEDYTKIDGDLDFVLDAVGKADYTRARSLLKPEGIYTATDFGPNGGNLWHILRSQFARSRRFVFPLPKDSRSAVDRAADLLERGELRAVVDRVHSLEEIVDAYRYVETGEKVGIVVIEMGSESD